MNKKKYTPLELMNMAIEESRKSIPEHDDKTDPLVGALIATKDGILLAKAHRGELREGEHCEYTLIERKLASENLKDCVLYVTLEPCTDVSRNKGKRGCSTHVVKARLSKVYVGIEDPNPKIATEGIKYLESKGITVYMFKQELGDIIRQDNAQFIKEKEAEALLAKTITINVERTLLQQPAKGATVKDLDADTINKFIKIARATFKYPSLEFNKWAEQFEFIEKISMTNEYKPTGLGIILFGKNPEHQFPQIIFKVEINYGRGKSEIRDFKGALVKQLPEIVDFIKDKGLEFTMDKSSGSRKEVANFPFEVLLEAIGNAVIHRDYTIKGATNYLYIDSEKIIVRSPGSPFLPITLDDLKNFDAPSLSRNPKIMYVFNQMRLAEQRGIGLRGMKDLPEAGFPLPSFRMKAGALEIIFGRTRNFIAKQGNVKNLTEENKLAYLFIQKKGEVSRGEFATEFAINDKTAQRRLAKLVDLKLVVMSGDKRGARYKAKGYK
jgi:ATP-dependent DNA helicase RecG